MNFLSVLIFLFLALLIKSDEQGESLLDKQAKLAEIYSNLSSGTEVNDNKQLFTFDSPHLYQNEEALKHFLAAYRKGLLTQQGVYTINSSKIRKDTKIIFDLLYFSKDFNTFYNLSKWALIELNRMEFGMAFLTAALHREDTRNLYLPPLYEIFPDYFIAADIMHKATIAKLRGDKVKTFQVNNTGNEWSWHRETINGLMRTTHLTQINKWNGADTTSRLSYFREDVNLSHNLQSLWILLCGWLDSKEYPIKFFRAGEKLFHHLNLIMRRYDMERLSNGLPPTEPLDHDAPLEEGYNPGLADPTGRNLATRPNGVVPSKLNAEGIRTVKDIENRLTQLIDMGQLKNMSDNNVVKLDNMVGLDLLSKIMFGSSSAISSEYYKPLFLHLIDAYDGMLTSANNVDYNPGALGSLLTSAKDPVFYRILATVMKYFDRHLSKLPPYTVEELSLTGVEIKNFEVSELMTTFDRHSFSLNNGIIGADWNLITMTASQFRLNVKPFSYKIKVVSDKETDVYMKLFIGPKTDALGRLISVEKARKLFYLFDTFKLKLVPGENDIERNSTENTMWTEVMHNKHFLEIQKTYDFSNTQSKQCGLPKNLVLPRGWKQGKTFRIFIIILPVKINQHDEGYFPCDHHIYYDNITEMSPFDRTFSDDNVLASSNMVMKDVIIYNEF